MKKKLTRHAISSIDYSEKVFSFLKKKKSARPEVNITIDVHSHLVPGIDDGVESYEEAMEVVRCFSNAGYRKLITTPHIMKDFYNNSEADIQERVGELNSRISAAGMGIEIQPCAEYYLDDNLMERIRETPDELLTFGSKYLLFETSFLNEPLYLNEFIFEARSRGFQPVMAHPERYAFIHSDFEMVTDLINREVLLQVNINSFTGYYSKMVKKTAEKLVDKGFVHLLGSDCHNMRHFEVLQKAWQEKYYSRALKLPLINYNL